VKYLPVDQPDLAGLLEILKAAEAGAYAVGSFSPRYTPVIAPVLRAGKKQRSPLIVQISQIEMERGGITPNEFSGEFYRQMKIIEPGVPVCLHLDHTRTLEGIWRAVESGFTSVMIDASALSLEDNIALTKEVVEYAHAHGVSVEAELGRIGTADFMETDIDEELFTDPQEAAFFAQETGVDALAVSVGTAHGVYTVRQPRIDIERLKAIRSLTPVPLVLHVGSGVPAELIRQAVAMPGGGISKINIATDLELALLEALQLARMPNRELVQLSDDALQPALDAVRAVVEDKIISYLGSQGRG
jgi:ketose-bisphosphate aldolase